MRRPASRSRHSRPPTEDSTVVLTVRVTPRAGADALAGWSDGLLHVRLSAPPIDGRANEALIRYLAACAGLSPSRLRLVAGARGRRKRIAFQGIDEPTLRARLALPPDAPLRQ